MKTPTVNLTPGDCPNPRRAVVFARLIAVTAFLAGTPVYAQDKITVERHV